jgi:uncharacterized membrane protein YphA (DoxX/SURF4 family)
MARFRAPIRAVGSVLTNSHHGAEAGRVARVNFAGGYLASAGLPLACPHLVSFCVSRRYSEESIWRCGFEGITRLVANRRTIRGSRGARMEQNASSAGEANQSSAAIGLAIVRLTIGAMLFSVFFENLGKGLYTAAGYAGLINGYIAHTHAPAVWKSVMALAANHASMAAPLQGVTEISLGVLLILGLFTRPVGFIAFLWLMSLWVSEWGIGWVWELLPPMMAALAVSIGRGGRTWGVDSLLARKNPSSPLW